MEDSGGENLKKIFNLFLRTSKLRTLFFAYPIVHKALHITYMLSIKALKSPEPFGKLFKTSVAILNYLKSNMRTRKSVIKSGHQPI